MRRSAPVIAFAVTLAACHARDAELDRMTIEPPGHLKQALSLFTELQATAALVPKGAAPEDAKTLTRADDGVSFSGFVAADPGDYTLELVFTGLFGGMPDRLFLGRWTSDAFTVVRGEIAKPTFSRALDTIGRPEDHGDDDHDQLGVLDELLWHADPTKADTDGDGVDDGSDCTPSDANDTFEIATNASIDDCDGDGARRPDLPIGTPGDDCDDRDAAISPRITDNCGDGLDADCNPATCPNDTGGGPRIVLIEPTASSTVGCHRRIAARITDSAGITSAKAMFLDDADPPATLDTATMSPESSNVFASGTLDRAVSIWLTEGPQKIRIQATNNRGSSSQLDFSVSFALGVPQVTMTPAIVGAKTAPFEVTINASAATGIATISLMRSQLLPSGDVERATELELMRVEDQNSLTFTVDPTGLGIGEYALYPIVFDNAGNQLRPDDSFSFDSSTSEIDPDYLCLFDPGGKMPVRDLIIEGPPDPGFMPAKMRDHFDEAIMEAAMRDPVAQLVEIRGDEIEPNGYIALDSTTADGKWLYTFFNFTDNRRVEVTWYSASRDVTNPVVEVTEMDPFGFSFHPFANMGAIVDSDVAAAAYAASMGCPALTGSGMDLIRFLSDQPFTAADVVRVDVGNVEWKATATDPVTQIWMCM